MIPRLIHQTWKTATIPDRFRSWSQSWSDHNPSWKRILWSDRMLLAFVAEHYPDFLEIYCGYPRGIMRADAGRYLLLHHFGGIYADLDTECLGPVEQLAAEDRVVLCHEAPSHWPIHAPFRGLPHILFNGVMASPARHPFWRHLIDLMRSTRNARDVLDATGPLLLTGAAAGYSNQSALAVHSCHLFNGYDKHGVEAPDYLGSKPTSLARHYWAGTWFAPDRPSGTADKLRLQLYKTRAALLRGSFLDPSQVQATVDKAALNQDAPRGNAIAILVPVRNAADHIAPFIDAIDALDFPKDRLKIVFCEGDSSDDTLEKLTAVAEARRSDFRDVILLRQPVGNSIPADVRWKPKYQRSRRAGLAKVRNHLIDRGLDGGDDWALWIDIDVWRFPSDTIQRLLAAKARIVTPNCVTQPGGVSFDCNSFISRQPDRDWRFFRDIRNGLHQPPPGAWDRLYLSDLRYLDRVKLHAVGGTMLLVDAGLHRAGLRFPQLPYEYLIETEGLGAVARDLGLELIGLPKMEILHVPW